MGKVYIFGHQSPDTDAVTAAINLSYLKNQLGMDTEPRVLGHVNKETKFALNYFGVKEPAYLNDVKLQLKDVEYLKGVYINKDSSIYSVYNYLMGKGITGTPIVEDNNKYVGIVTIKDIAKQIINGNLNSLDAKYDNILSVLEGEEVLKFDEEIKGNLLVASYKSTTFLNNVNLTEDNILIVGDRHSIIENAVSKKVKLLIVTGNGDIKDEHLNIAKENKVNIIRTKKDSFNTSKLIGLCSSVKSIIKEDNSKVFKENDYYDEFIAASKKMKHNNYPILNNNNECLGLIRITEIAKKNNKEVILVDHQEKEQSVIGLDEASILEIVDHHKIGNINTNNPINFRNMTVGSTNTILYFMYEESNVEIPKHIAGLMLSGILSDTLCLQSPTTTDLDKKVVENLSKIAEVDYEKYAFEMFKAGTSLVGKTVDEIFNQDFKKFSFDNLQVGVAQVNSMDIEGFLPYKKDMLDYMNKFAEDNNLEFTLLLLTDIINANSEIFVGGPRPELVENAFNVQLTECQGTLAGVISRKKQVVPAITAVMSE